MLSRLVQVVGLMNLLEVLISSCPIFVGRELYLCDFLGKEKHFACIQIFIDLFVANIV